MFCEKCGTNNVPAAKFCAGCGANLQQQAANSYRDGFQQSDTQAQNGYSQGYQQDYGSAQGYPQGGYRYDYGYQPSYRQPRTPGSGLNIVSIIVSVLAGLLALTCIGMMFIPSISMAFIPSISINNKTTNAAGGNARFCITYLNTDTKKKLTEDAKTAYLSGNEYSYDQNFVEFAIQNFNSLYHSDDSTKASVENYKKYNKDYEQLATDSTDYTIRAIIALAMFIIPMIFLFSGAIMAFLRRSGAAGLLMTGGIISLIASIYWTLFINNVAPLGRVFFIGAYSNSGVFHANTGAVMTAAPVLMIIFSALTIAASVGVIVVNKAKERA